jgi:8-oxo-dGTP diphosphatase
VLWRHGRDGPQVLLQHRAGWDHDGGTWAVPGGARDSHEDPVRAALREAHEEVGVRAEDLQVGETLTGTDHEDWRYDYVLAEASPRAEVRAANDETAALGWVGLAHEPGLPLHSGLARDWGRLVAAVRDVVARPAAR